MKSQNNKEIEWQHRDFWWWQWWWWWWWRWLLLLFSHSSSGSSSSSNAAYEVNYSIFPLGSFNIYIYFNMQRWVCQLIKWIFRRSLRFKSDLNLPILYPNPPPPPQQKKTKTFLFSRAQVLPRTHFPSKSFNMQLRLDLLLKNAKGRQSQPSHETCKKIYFFVLAMIFRSDKRHLLTQK